MGVVQPVLATQTTYRSLVGTPLVHLANGRFGEFDIDLQTQSD